MRKHYTTQYRINTFKKKKYTGHKITVLETWVTNYLRQIHVISSGLICCQMTSYQNILIFILIHKKRRTRSSYLQVPLRVTLDLASLLMQSTAMNICPIRDNREYTHFQDVLMNLRRKKYELKRNLFNKI